MDMRDEYIKKETLISIFEAKADMALGSPKHFFLSMAEMVRKLPAADVIVPPCKVGDTVYRVAKRRGVLCVLPREVVSITHRLDHLYRLVWEIFSTEYDRLGKTVFLTREEAEKALAERSNENAE